MKMPRIKWIGFILAVGLGYGLAQHYWSRSRFPTYPPSQYPAHPYPGIQYEYRTVGSPPSQVYVAKVDLSNPNVDVRVAGAGPDPDGAGPFQTTLEIPSVIAAREKFELAVNGDFFDARDTVNMEGAHSEYVPGKPAKVLGPCVIDGKLWGAAAIERPTMWFDKRKLPHLTVLRQPPKGATQAIAGSTILVAGGIPVVKVRPGVAIPSDPRTAIGLGGDGHTLVVVVVDGRSRDSAGMTLPELAVLMRDLGCKDALNLDGGGSSEIVARLPDTGELQVLNVPSDTRERAVANVLGISIRGSFRKP